MQQENNTPAPQPAFTSWVLDLLKEHYGWVSVIAAGLGILNLAIYTHHIGRPDVFMSSLEFGPGLILLWITHLFFFVVLIGSMLFPSLVFAGGLSALRPKPEYAASIVRVLTGLTAFAMLGVVIPIGAAAYRDETASPWWALTVLVVPALCSWFFLHGNIAKTELLTDKLKSWRMLLACVALTGLLGLTALVGIYPALFVTQFYEERGAMGGWGEALFFCFVVMVGSLAPAVGYHNQLLKGKPAQFRGGFFGFGLFAALLILTVPSLLIFPSVVSAKFLGITDREVKRYLIVNEEYPADSLDTQRWSITRSEAKKYLLHGFSLYANGPIALLCPADLAKLPERELHKYTAQCVPFDESAVKPLDVVEQIPSDDVSGRRR
jgi:hypothetical protein